MLMGFGFLGAPFGVVMRVIFQIVQNYGVALFIFTVLSRVIIAPFMFKQQKSMGKMAIIQPEIKEIQKKYAKNKQKMNQEMQALYAKVGYNPMTGCLPMALQMVVLFGVIEVIFRPLTHILRLGADVIYQANTITREIPAIQALPQRALTQAIELTTMSAINEYPQYFAAMPADAVYSIQHFLPQMNFLGINLMEIPTLGMFLEIFSGFNMVLLIPILSGLTSLAMTLNMRNSPQMASGGNTKIITMIMPVFSVFLTFQVPAGVGIFWIYSNIVGFFQNMITNKLYDPKAEAEAARLKFEEERELERQKRQEAKQKAKERRESGLEDDVEDMESLTKKEQNRRKLAEARRRDAEKYGEELLDSDDD